MNDKEPTQTSDILTTFSVATKAEGILTKIIRNDHETGTVVKDGSQCSMYSGSIQQKNIRTFQQLGDGLRRLESNQALVHGVSQYKKAAITTVRRLPKVKPKPGALPVIARSKEHIAYPDGPALMMFDHDKARPDSVAENDGALQSFVPADLIQLISKIMPEIANAGWVSTPSTSSCIYDQNGKELRGEGSGSHTYFVVEHGPDIPRFLDVMGKRLFLAGYGRFEISRAGSLLSRTLIDLSVGSPERLDFAAGAVCKDGLVQKLPLPQVQEGARLDTALLPDLTPAEEEEYAAIKARLTEIAKPSQAIVREKYIEQEASKLSTERGISRDEAREVILSRQNHILTDGDQLYFAHLKGKAVSVAEVLDNPIDYDKKSLADPLEPEYDGGSLTKALFYWNDGRPIINSFAHGETKYTFERFKKAATEEPPREAGKKPAPTKADLLDPVKILEAFEMPQSYVDHLGAEEYLFPNLVIRNHILTIIAMPNGGKTTIFFYHICPGLAQKGLTVWYIDLDSPPSDHKRMKATADEHGFKLLNPDSQPGQSIEGLMVSLQEIADSDTDLSNWVFVVDTLKKIANLMDKSSVKAVYKLARKLTARGATVILLGHANKYRDREGNLVFEGTGDVRADSDELIFFERTTRQDGGLDVTTVVDPDKGAKVRGLFEQISFNISADREVTTYKDPLPTIDFTATATPKATDDDIVDAARKYLIERNEPVPQRPLVQHVSDVTATGEKRVRQVLVQNAEAKDALTLRGLPFLYTVGLRNAHSYEVAGQ